jgi:NAD(P)-dependent dehydrogenase (short-subunit alcohol dehydrogenase family)
MSDEARPAALITGASRGLGLEVARLFARRGYDLILTARGADALTAAARELDGLTGVFAAAGDVADREHTAALVRGGLERFGRIDVLINNASELGPSPLLPLESYPLDALVGVFAVNVLAPLHLIQLVLPAMRARGTGVIINVTSDAGVEAYPTWGGYGASKAALEHVSRTLAAELEGTGIRVYVVDPGDMDTAMHRAAEPGEDLSHLPPPSVSAPAFLWLVEKESAPAGRFSALTVVTERGLVHAGT